MATSERSLPTHHPTQEILAGYAAGNLAEPFALLAATHLSFCPSCRGDVAEFEAIGGALLEDMAPEELGEERLRRALEGMAKFEPVASAPAEQTSHLPAELEGRLPEPLRSYVAREGSALHWRRHRRLWDARLLPGRGRITTRLLRIKAGAAMPRHTHGGAELTLVLGGAFSDELGRYGPGDVAFADASVVHRPVAEPGEDCLCLAVHDGPLRLAGWSGRMLSLSTGGR